MFETKFARDSWNGEEGRRYRRIVLENREGKPAMDTRKEFLGQAATSDAFANSSWELMVAVMPLTLLDW
jgi:hypothetical protein